MYKLLNNLIEMDDYSVQRLSKSSSIIEYIWYKLWGNTVQSGTPTPDTPIEMVSCGDRTENLWSGVYKENIAFANGSYATPTIYPRTIVYIPVVGGQTYSFSIGRLKSDTALQSVFSINEPAIGVSYMIGGQTTFVNHGSITQFVRQAPESANWLAVQIMDVDNLENGIMLNTGNEPLPYEPYGYKIPIVCDNEIKNIYLNEPLHKIGDYADILSYQDHNVTRKIKKLVLTGEETWFIYTESYPSHFITYAISDRRRNITPYCTHYVGSTVINYSGLKNAQISVSTSPSSNNRPRTTICDTRFLTIDDFKSYLQQQYAAGTPVTVWYVLATEETEQIKAPDILADKYTSITVDTEVQPSQVDFTTKGKHVPQLSSETVRKMNAENKAKIKEVKSIEESKEEFEEPMEKEFNFEEEYAEIKEIEKEGEEDDKSDKSE